MKIVTFTANPAVDCFIKTAEFAPGQISNAVDMYSAPGGKGINASRIIRRFSFAGTALFTQGGNTGKELQNLLRTEGVPFSSFHIAEETRKNYVIEDEKKGRYKINTPPPNLISSSTQEELADWVLLHCKKNDILYIAGSLLKNMTSEFYSYIALRAQDKGVRCAFDISGKYISEAANLPFTFLKANLSEIKGLNSNISTIETVPDFIPELPSKEIIVSSGKSASLLFTDNTIYKAIIQKKSPHLCTGCGDTLFAGYVLKRVQGVSAAEAFHSAMALALGTAFAKVYALALPKDIALYKDFIEISRISQK